MPGNNSEGASMNGAERHNSTIQKNNKTLYFCSNADYSIYKCLDAL